MYSPLGRATHCFSSHQQRGGKEAVIVITPNLLFVIVLCWDTSDEGPLLYPFQLRLLNNTVGKIGCGWLMRNNESNCSGLTKGSPKCIVRG